MTVQSASSSCMQAARKHGFSLTVSRVANAVSANLEDNTALPLKPEIHRVVKQQGWVSDEYEHLWRRDGGGSAALTSHGILSRSRI